MYIVPGSGLGAEEKKTQTQSWAVRSGGTDTKQLRWGVETPAVNVHAVLSEEERPRLGVSGALSEFLREKTLKYLKCLGILTSVENWTKDTKIGLT